MSYKYDRAVRGILSDTLEIEKEGCRMFVYVVAGRSACESSYAGVVPKGYYPDAWKPFWEEISGPAAGVFGPSAGAVASEAVDEDDIDFRSCGS